MSEESKKNTNQPSNGTSGNGCCEARVSAPAGAPESVQTDKSITIDSATIEYAAIADWLLLRKNEKPSAQMFHVAYFKKGEHPSDRPITFVFNGGPGAASAYLHMGAIGPRVAHFNADGTAPKPPATIVDNPLTWLLFTDLVFVDPVGTGFSRIIDEDDKEDKDKKTDPKEYYGVESDLKALGEFMQRFLSEHLRWESPVFVAGESYGGFRAARLTKLVQQGYGIGLSGAVVISPALEFTLLDPSDYDTLHWVDLFPTLAAAASYHGKSDVLGQEHDGSSVLDAAERFALNNLTRILSAGTLMPEKERSALEKEVAAILGLGEDFVRQRSCRISAGTFARELLKGDRRVLGMYDATITASDPYPDRDTFGGPDPTLWGIERVFTAAINTYLRKELGVQTDRDYRLLSMDVNEAWKVDGKKHALESQVGATDDLRYGMALNPHMQVLISHGIYDMVTPYFAANRIAAHMNLDPSLSPNLQIKHFAGGHMFYTWEDSRKNFADTVEKFFKRAVSG